MDEFFSSEGPLLGFLQQLGNLILLSIIFIVCSLPVFTFGTASSALYYAVVKSIRRGRGYPVKEYMKAFKRNLKNGTILTLLFGGVAALVLNNRLLINQASAGDPNAAAGMVMGNPDGNMLTLFIIYDGILILLACVGIWLFPVLSRFAMKLTDIIKLSFVIAVRFFYYTVLLVTGMGILLYLQWKIFPILTVLILPGVWTYASSYLIERAMKKYTPAPKEGEDAWYLE